MKNVLDKPIQIELTTMSELSALANLLPKPTAGTIEGFDPHVLESVCQDIWHKLNTAAASAGLSQHDVRAYRPIVVGGSEVVFAPDGSAITVGCTTVPAEQVILVHKELMRIRDAVAAKAGATGPMDPIIPGTVAKGIRVLVKDDEAARRQHSFYDVPVACYGKVGVTTGLVSDNVDASGNRVASIDLDFNAVIPGGNQHWWIFNRRDCGTLVEDQPHELDLKVGDKIRVLATPRAGEILDEVSIDPSDEVMGNTGEVVRIYDSVDQPPAYAIKHACHKIDVTINGTKWFMPNTSEVIEKVEVAS